MWWQGSTADYASNFGFRDRNSVARTATCYGLDSLRGSKFGEGKIFLNRPDRPWGPPSLLQNEYRVIPGGRAEAVRPKHPPLSSAEVKEMEQL